MDDALPERSATSPILTEAPLPEPAHRSELQGPRAPLETHKPQAQAHSPGLAASVSDQIGRTRISEGRTVIELAPRGLGSIEIDLKTDETGQLRVVLRAENPAVLAALRSDRALLMSVLGDSQPGLGDAALDFEEFNQPRQNTQLEDSRHRLGTRSESDEPTEPLRTTLRPRAQGAGRLDILT
ncbi:flagellar hook-length control protein FliK [Litorisediminicola beolgyonensis]|uniref:Flagellar hook-length control protein FliK n=1 Tax=Litorisediminicola beolgyonensis TaxID=1173614 RepID=A0ABW3ZFY2_9RHOB